MISPTIKINDATYVLHRQGDGRLWEEGFVEAPSKMEQRPDVFPGQDGRYAVVWDNWSNGVAGDIEGLPDSIYLARNAHGMIPGQLMPVSDPYVAEQTEDHTGGGRAATVEFAWAGTFNGDLFTIINLYVYKWANGTVALDHTLAACATDAIVFNDSLRVAIGPSTKIEFRDTAGTWTVATDNVYLNFFTNVEGRLWVANNVNEVSNIGPTDDPGLLASYSAAIAIGDDDLAITDLNAYGERLAVSKVNGLYLGDAEAIFPNVLPQLEDTPDGRNGVNTIVKGASIFYPHSNGVIRYTLGIAEEVGLNHVVMSQSLGSVDIPQGVQIRAMAVDGPNVWAATETSGFLRQAPTGFKKTANSGGAYTSYTTEVTDGNPSTVADISSLDTIANGDWFIVGGAVPFYGITLELANPNTTATPSLTVQYWNGAAWTAMPNATAVSDFTTIPSHASAVAVYNGTLRRSGTVMWRNSGLGSWATSTIDGTLAYWMRFGVSSALDNGVTIMDCQLIITQPGVYLYRGRPATTVDLRGGPIIWEHYGYIDNMITPAAIIVTHDMYPHYRRDQICVVARNNVAFFRVPMSPWEGESSSNVANSYAILPVTDGGMPFTEKYWGPFRIKMRNDSGARTVTLQVRADEAAAWSSVATNISTSGSYYTTAFQGKRCQIRVIFNAYTGNKSGYNSPPIVQAIEAVFQPYPERFRTWTQQILIHDNQALPTGGVLPSSLMQLTALENLVKEYIDDSSGMVVTYVDPMGRSLSVRVREVKVQEIIQVERQSPQLVVQVTVQEHVTS